MENLVDAQRVKEGDRVIVILRDTFMETTDDNEQSLMVAILEELNRIGLGDRSTVFVSSRDDLEVHVIRGEA